MLYIIESIELVTKLPTTCTYVVDGVQLIVVLDAGELIITDKPFIRHMKAGQCMVIQAHQQLQIEQTCPNNIRMFLMKIHNYDHTINDIYTREASLFLSNKIFELHSYEQKDIRTLYALWQQSGTWNHMQAQALFLQWAIGVGERIDQVGNYDAEQLIYQVIRYIEENYSSTLSREQLAQRTGFSHAYYSRLFKQTIGKSSQDYVTEVRMKHARRLLLNEEGTIVDVASKVGYSNSLYFSRMFKKHVGVSPTVYINRNQKKPKIAALNNQYTGHLLSLGLEPCASSGRKFQESTSLLNSTLFLNRYEGEEPDLKTLMESEPELILVSEYTTEEQLRQLEKVSETMKISFETQDWRSQLMEIAYAVGYEHQAQDWLAAYEEQSRVKAAEVQGLIGDATIISILVRPHDCYVAGFRHIGAVLYQDLKLNPPAFIEQQQRHYITSGWQMDKLSADYIVLTFHPSLTATDKLRWLESPWWRAQEAVKRNRVYHQDISYVLSSYTSFSHRLLLEETPKQMRSLLCI
ncbi:AraC family transcriptional regulator [Paenibacillus endoradicis]|uniref:AraC family transcriptional regulator n=1 Tax=Paenibacillus endoradicis TaxID=2972487 RepID=UPI0021590299|nr:AraC family transcriptional regulator [Paenibacillus endoradicis]MCR8658641.1 AraC family transcriptional regulator [Paenibacillus endoradicis]